MLISRGSMISAIVVTLAFFAWRIGSPTSEEMLLESPSRSINIASFDPGQSLSLREVVEADLGEIVRMRSLFVQINVAKNKRPLARSDRA